MNTTSITPWIGVTIGRDTRLFYGYITTAPAALDAPATITLSTAPLVDQSELALDEFVFDSCRARTKARLILVDATERSHQKRRCRQHGHLIAEADPALAELNTLEDSLWHRLGVSLDHQQSTSHTRDDQLAMGEPLSGSRHHDHHDQHRSQRQEQATRQAGGCRAAVHRR